MHHPRSVLRSLAAIFGLALPVALPSAAGAPPSVRLRRSGGYWNPPPVHDRPRPPAPGTQFCPELEALGAEGDGATLQRALSLASSLKREQVRRVKQMARVAGKSPARYLLDVAAAA